MSLSVLTMGTMRLDRKPATAEAALELLAEMVECGVDCFHTSTEYESFELFSASFRRVSEIFSDRHLTIIGKVGVPHFGEEHFRPARFEAEVNRYLDRLNIDCLDVVQWLLRFDLKQEGRRIEIFDRDAEKIQRTVEVLQQAGKIRSMVCFPYTTGIGTRALDAPWCDGLALYVNPLERSLADLLDLALARKKGVIGIRPFAAGRAIGRGAGLTGEDRRAMNRLAHVWADLDPVERALRYALAHPAVTTATVSLSNSEQVGAATTAVAFAGPDEHAFRRVTAG